jgi:hypothetical protein
MDDQDKWVDTWVEEGKEDLASLNPFWKAMDKESDRAIAIISAILLDNLLERLIKASYIKDPRVDTIFKNDHILRSFHTKISIAYFSGLIPKFLYNDLKLICEIRNKFAHDVVADLEFDDRRIVQRIDQFSQIHEELIKIYPPKLRFLLNLAHIAGLWLSLCRAIRELSLPNIVAELDMGGKQFADMILTPEEIQNILADKEDNQR